jgi:cell division protein FtsB
LIEITKDPQMAQQEVRKAAPYAPSFIDRFTGFVQRQPLPYWLTYLLLFLLESALLHVLSWVDGWLPAYRLGLILFLFPFWLWGSLAIVTYLDSLSLRAISEFEPLLRISTETKRQLKYEFTTMPARSVLLSATAWSVVFVLSWFLGYNSAVAVYGWGPLTTWLNFAAGFVSFSVGSVIYYHSIRQLRLVSRTVQMVSQFDLFRLDPAYAFSFLTSRTGISWVALLTLSLLMFPLEVGGITELSYLVLQIALASGAFLLPLRFVNRRLVLEKRGQLAELDQRTKATLARMHQLIDENDLREVPRLNDVLKALTTEREILAKIPTWPWRPGLFAGFLSVIVIPIVLFLLQFGLSEWLGH